MRKLTLMLSMFLLVGATLTGCSKNKAEETPTIKTETVTEDAVSKSESDTVVLDDTVAKLSGFDYSKVFDAKGFVKGIKANDLVTNLFDYKKLEIPTDTSTVTDEAVEGQIQAICYYYGILKEVKDREIKAGDTVNIDYIGYIDGVEFEGGGTNGQGTDVTAGSEEYIDDFLTQIIGHKPGETMDVVVTFPDDYGDEALNGKEAVFKTTLNYISEVGELTDADVVTNLSFSNGWTTVKETKEGIRTNLENSQIRSYIVNYVVDFAKENVDIAKLPEAYVNYYEEVSVAYFQDAAANTGMSYKEYLSTFLQVDSIESLLATVKEGNDGETLNAIVIQAIAEQENIEITAEDIEDYISSNSNEDDSLETFTEQFGLPYIKHIVLQQKVIQFIYDNAKIK